MFPKHRGILLGAENVPVRSGLNGGQYDTSSRDTVLHNLKWDSTGRCVVDNEGWKEYSSVPMAPYRRIVMIWLAVWMLAVPLVHVHPEADHQHGQASHFYGGITHSVFSADLPCEYHTGSPSHAPYFTDQATHEFDHPEIGFSLLTASPDRNAGKPVLDCAVFWGTTNVSIRPSLKFIAAASAESAISVVLPLCLSTRAPPSTSFPL